MQIFIDGYNLIKQVLQKKDISKNELKYFIGILQRYAVEKKNKIVIVFDGGQSYHVEKTQVNSWLILVYSGYVTSADQVLIEYLTRIKDRPLIVVSSDREIRDAAYATQATSLKSIEFWKILQENFFDKKIKKNIVVDTYKTSLEKNDRLDALMSESCQPPDEKYNNEEETFFINKNSKISKKEKKLQKIIKKL